MQNEILTVDEGLPFEFNRLLAYTLNLIGSLIVIGYSTFSIYFVLLFIIFSYYYKNLYNDYTIASKYLDYKRNEVNQVLTSLFLDTLEYFILIIKLHNFFLILKIIKIKILEVKK
jgi:hypothetical protein